MTSGKLTEIILHQLCDAWAAQVTFAMALIEIRLEQLPSLKIFLNLREMLPLGAQRLREAVSEMKGHKLSEPRFIAMWQVTAFVPAAEALPGIGDFGCG